MNVTVNNRQLIALQDLFATRGYALDVDRLKAVHFGLVADYGVLYTVDGLDALDPEEVLAYGVS